MSIYKQDKLMLKLFLACNNFKNITKTQQEHVQEVPRSVKPKLFKTFESNFKQNNYIKHAAGLVTINIYNT